MNLSRFAKYSWGVLLYTIAVILWGAFVRATGSGAGCGSHWPLCNGEIVPRAPQASTIIEFTHRLSSGLAFLLVVGLLIWAWRSYAVGHSIRKAALWAMIFMISESLVGAGLVLFEWVAEDTSAARAAVVSVHLINTHMLLAAITLTAWWASSEKNQKEGIRPIPRGMIIGMLAVLLLSMAGAVTALGDTLFPASKLVEGIQQDFSPTAHFLVRLRVIHPIIAIVAGIYLAYVTKSAIAIAEKGSIQHKLGVGLIALYGLQLLAGLINLLLLAPVWMQIVHLLLADLVWICLVLLGSEMSSSGKVQLLQKS